MPSSQPLRCTSPADVYMLLKSSDFISHDLGAESVFEECADIDDDDEEEEGRGGGDGGGAKTAYDDDDDYYKLELVLRKWFAIDPSREMRAFVRDGALVGTSLRLCFVTSHAVTIRSVGHRHRHRFQGISQRDEELLRVSERARDAAQDRLVVRRALDGARQAKVDRPSIL